MSRRSRLPVVLVALGVSMFFALSASPSSADSESSSPDAVADVITDHFDGQISQAAPAETTETSEALSIESVSDPESGGLDVPIDVDAPIQFPGDDLSVTLEGAQTQPADSGIIDDRVIHPDTFRSTDTIVSPTSEAGFEVYYLLENSAAPEEFTSSVQTPEYAHLEQVDSTTAEVVNDSGEVLMTIDAPWARDAAGKSVAISLRVEGDHVITHVDHQDNNAVTYPILADPDFYTRGDNVHISSTAPRAVSAHGWWIVDEDACDCLNDATADINVKIQWYHSGSWTTVESKTTEKVKPGGGSSRRAAAREVCSASGTANKWRSVIDVDVRGWIDSSDKKITPTQTIYCTP